MANDIEAVWTRIRAHQGETFRQKKGKVFTCVVTGDRLNPDTTNRNLSRSQFAQALALVPLEGPGDVNHRQGPSYLYAILMDERIRKSDW